MAEEEEKEHFMTIGCDPHGDEPTKVDEERRYFRNVDDTVNDEQPLEKIEVEVQTKKRPRPTPNFDTKCVPDDEAAIVDDYDVPHTTYDIENPIIKEGDTFGDKDEFILSMRTYAIKMSLRLELNIVTLLGIGQSVQIKIVIGEFLQRSFMVATHLWLLFFLYSLFIVDSIIFQFCNLDGDSYYFQLCRWSNSLNWMITLV